MKVAFVQSKVDRKVSQGKKILPKNEAFDSQGTKPM